MKEFWGDDADSFNPDRFDVGGIPRVNVPGVYGNLLTFLGGARNCMYVAARCQASCRIGGWHLYLY
jgi:cytochrome P450